MITITGGKLTTWRRMAKMAVDRLVEREAGEAPCRTHEIPLGQAASEEDLPAVEGVDDDSRRMLAGRYGYAARRVLTLAEERPELRARIVPALPDLLAEVVVAVQDEQAFALADVLLRRTRLGLLDARTLVGESEAARAVAGVMAAEIGWDGTRVEAELAAWREVAAAEGIAVPTGAAGAAAAA
jgi:glycerol-3-phosphate dehydrogenase